MKSLVVLIFISSFAIAKIGLVNKSFPTEFQFVFEEVQKHPTVMDFKGQCLELEKNLSKISRKHIFYIIKSDIYKSILDYEYNTYAPTVALNQYMLSQMKQKFSRIEKKMTRMSRWIFRSFLADLDYRLKQGGKVTSMAEAKFLRPWIRNMSTKNAVDFNKITNLIAIDVFNRLVVTSRTFKDAIALNESSKTPKYFIFNDKSKEMPNKPSSKETQGQRLNEIIPTEDELAAEIDKIEKEVNGDWSPKE